MKDKIKEILKCPCDGCEGKIDDAYGRFCDLACGKYSAWCNYKAGAEDILALIPEVDKGGLLTKQELVAAYFNVPCKPELDDSSYIIDRSRRIAKAQLLADEIRIEELEKQNADYQEDCADLARQLVEADDKHRKEKAEISKEVESWITYCRKCLGETPETTQCTYSGEDVGTIYLGAVMALEALKKKVTDGSERT